MLVYLLRRFCDRNDRRDTQNVIGILLTFFAPFINERIKIVISLPIRLNIVFIQKVDLFSGIGGSLGLCIGVSMMSFCELFEVLAEIVLILIKNKTKWANKINPKASVTEKSELNQF